MWYRKVKFNVATFWSIWQCSSRKEYCNGGYYTTTSPLSRHPTLWKWMAPPPWVLWGGADSLAGELLEDQVPGVGSSRQLWAVSVVPSRVGCLWSLQPSDGFRLSARVIYSEKCCCAFLEGPYHLMLGSDALMWGPNACWFLLWKQRILIDYSDVYYTIQWCIL